MFVFLFNVTDLLNCIYSVESQAIKWTGYLCGKITFVIAALFKTVNVYLYDRNMSKSYPKVDK